MSNQELANILSKMYNDAEPYDDKMACAHSVWNHIRQ